MTKEGMTRRELIKALAALPIVDSIDTKPDDSRVQQRNGQRPANRFYVDDQLAGELLIIAVDHQWEPRSFSFSEDANLFEHETPEGHCMVTFILDWRSPAMKRLLEESVLNRRMRTFGFEIGGAQSHSLFAGVITSVVSDASGLLYEVEICWGEPPRWRP